MVEKRRATKRVAQFVLSAGQAVVLATHKSMLAAEWYTAKAEVSKWQLQVQEISISM